jgi:two-component system chemotaxis response regulator CheY
MRMIVRRELRRAGFGDADVVEAGNGTEGLAAVEEHSPDLVLSDWNMPEMNGYEFLMELRARENTVPFGFVTSEVSPEIRTMANDAGALFMVTKPFTVDQFTAALACVAT